MEASRREDPVEDVKEAFLPGEECIETPFPLTQLETNQHEEKFQATVVITKYRLYFAILEEIKIRKGVMMD